MGYVAVDINKIKLDSPKSGQPIAPNTPEAYKATLDIFGGGEQQPTSRFVPVNINQIKLDNQQPPETIRPEEMPKMENAIAAAKQYAADRVAENPQQKLYDESLMAYQARQFGDSLPARLAKGWADRAGKVGSALAGEDNQRFNPLTNALTTVGQGMAAVGDIPAEIARSVYRDFTPDAAKRGVEGATKYVAGSAPVQKLQELAKEYPETAQNIGSVANIAVNAPFMKPAGTVLSGAGQKLNEVGKLRSVAKQADEEFLTKAASKIYKDPKISVLPPEARQQWFNSIQERVAIPEDAAPFLKGNPVADYAESMKAELNKPLSFMAAQRIDQDLTQRITEAVRAGRNADADAFGTIQRGLQQAMEVSPVDNIPLQKAKGMWAAQAKLRELSALEERAPFQRHASTGIQTGAKQIVTNKNKVRGWTDKELELLKSASDKSAAVGLLDTAGSRLGPIAAGAAGFAMGGLPAAGAAFLGDYVLGGAARKGAAALQASKLNKVVDAVKSRPVVQQAIKGAMESGELAPKFTALRALGVTMDKAGQLMRAGKPFDMKAAMQLAPQAAKPVLQEMKLLAAPDKMKPLAMSNMDIKAAQEVLNRKFKAPKASDTKVTVINATGDLPVIPIGDGKQKIVAASEGKNAAPVNVIDKGIIEYHGQLDGLVSELNNSLNGGRFFNQDVMGQGGTADITSWASGNPDWFKNAGFTKAEVNRAVEAIKSNKKLGARQMQIKQLLDSEIQRNFEKSLDPRFIEDIPF